MMYIIDVYIISMNLNNALFRGGVDPMIRTQIYLTESQKADLEAMSGQLRKPVASIIREAVSQYLVDKQSDVFQMIEGAQGLWADRTDLDAIGYPEQLRKKMDAHRKEKLE